MIKQEDIFRKIGSILNELQDQHDFFAQNSRHLNELELELFLANASFLVEHIQIVRKLNGNKPIMALPQHTEINPDEITESTETHSVSKAIDQEAPEMFESHDPEISVTEATVHEPSNNEELFKPDSKAEVLEFVVNHKSSAEKFEFEEKSVHDIFNQPLSEEEQEIIAQKQKLNEHKEPESFPLSPDEPPFSTANDVQPEPLPSGLKQVNTTKPTLNEMLANSLGTNKEVNQHGDKSAIADLKQAITLNQKLLFIKDLFNGYNLAYAEAIDLLNKMPDYKTADAFLQKNYAVKNNWTAKQAAKEKFYELLQQRFPG